MLRQWAYLQPPGSPVDFSSDQCSLDTCTILDQLLRPSLYEDTTYGGRCTTTRSVDFAWSRYGGWTRLSVYRRAPMPPKTNKRGHVYESLLKTTVYFRWEILLSFVLFYQWWNTLFTIKMYLQKDNNNNSNIFVICNILCMQFYDTVTCNYWHVRIK